MRRVLIIGVLGVALLGVTVAMPTSAPVPAALRVQEASATPQDCWQVAKKTYKSVKALTKSPPTAAKAYVQAMRRTQGCGDTMADWLCIGSQNRWGYAHRAIVRGITGGDYSRC